MECHCIYFIIGYYLYFLRGNPTKQTQRQEKGSKDEGPEEKEPKKKGFEERGTRDRGHWKKKEPKKETEKNGIVVCNFWVNRERIINYQ